MRQERLRTKKALTWFVAVSGIVIGFVALVTFGWAPIRMSEDDPRWSRMVASLAGFGLVALIFLVGSILALRNRRRAGLIFLLGAPAAVFCLAYPFAVSWDNQHTYYASLPAALWLSLLFFAPLAISLWMIPKSKKRALYLFLISIIVVAPFLYRSPWNASFLPALAVCSAFFGLFGAFWLITHKRGWHPLLAPRPRSLKRGLVAVCTACFVIVVVQVAATLIVVAWQSTPDPWISIPPLFNAPRSPEHVALTARLVRVGGHAKKISGRRVGEWAIGIVQERFWGLPWWNSRLVLLTDNIFWEGETYFVDGRRARGLLTHFLPIVETSLSSRTKPVNDASVELHVLRNNNKIEGMRVVGYVHRPEPFRSRMQPPVPQLPFAGAKIKVTGPLGTSIVVADRDGIYDFMASMHDIHSVEPELPATMTALAHGFSKEGPGTSGLWERSFELVWNGTIEGKASNTEGPVADLSVMVLNPDGTEVGGFGDIQQTGKDGSFHFGRIPPGRYILVVSPMGPSQKSPYPTVYYPSAKRRQDAQLIEVGEGQHVKNTDFRLGGRLTEHLVQVRVKWATGEPAAEPALCVQSENTSRYGTLECDYVSSPRPDGSGRIAVFEGSRIRVYALARAYDEKNKQCVTGRSALVELDASRLPETLDLPLRQ